MSSPEALLCAAAALASFYIQSIPSVYRGQWGGIGEAAVDHKGRGILSSEAVLLIEIPHQHGRGAGVSL